MPYVRSAQRKKRRKKKKKKKKERKMRMKKMRKRMMTREKRKQRKIQLGWKSRCKIAHPQPEPVKRPGGKRTRGTKLVPRGERPRRRYTLSS